MNEPREAMPLAVGAFLEGADAVRKLQGLAVEGFGHGPQTTPSRIVGHWPPATLLAYQPPDRDRPALLAVPAPIKAAYIFDLAPGASVVQRCVAAGVQVYLIEWDRPRASDASIGLAEYADTAIERCLQAIESETGQARPFIAGHSLGGTLAAIYASLYPARVRGLIELEGPMAFGANAGLAAAMARWPRAGEIGTIDGNVPGSFLDVASVWADPLSFNVEPWMDWMQSCFSPTAARTYAQVRRWTLDELPLPARLYEEVIECLYRDNRFATAALKIGERIADPRDLTAPILAVVNPHSRIVSSESVRAYRETGSKDVEIWEYGGDVGVMLQHVGVLIGENAHRFLWPRILQWVRAHFGAR